MKIFFFCFLLFCFYQTSYSQKGRKTIVPSSTPTKLNRTTYSFQKRLSFYPLNLTAQMKIVSFDKRIDTNLSNKRNSFIYGLPINGDSVCLSKISESVTLNLKQLDTITDIMYNTCNRWTIYETNKAACYEPHNAILYYGNNGKLLAYIEICFDCSQVKYSNTNIVQFKDCDIAINDLKQYFKKLGLKTSERDFTK